MDLLFSSKLPRRRNRGSPTRVNCNLLDVVSNILATSGVQFRELEQKYKKIIPFLHIESKYFRPKAFLEAFHSDSSKSALKVASKKISRFLEANSDIKKKTIYSNSTELLEVE